MVDYKKKVSDLLEEYMTERSFKLWQGINKILPNTWEKPTSSTGKWHKKLNGEVPSQAEHVYHMLYAATKIFRLFSYEKKSYDLDKLLFAISLHDSLKYGTLGNRAHTDRKHDKEAADMVSANKETFLKILTESQFYCMEEMIRFHSGQWSTDVPKNEKFDFSNYNKFVMFIHMLDMLSTADCLQTDVRG